MTNQSEVRFNRGISQIVKALKWGSLGSYRMDENDPFSITMNRHNIMVFHNRFHDHHTAIVGRGAVRVRSTSLYKPVFEAYAINRGLKMFEVAQFSINLSGSSHWQNSSSRGIGSWGFESTPPESLETKQMTIKDLTNQEVLSLETEVLGV